MNQNNLQQQIEQRCPCFVKPLKECDCLFNDDYSGLVGLTTCPLCGEVNWQND